MQEGCRLIGLQFSTMCGIFIRRGKTDARAYRNKIRAPKAQPICSKEQDELTKHSVNS